MLLAQEQFMTITQPIYTSLNALFDNVTSLHPEKTAYSNFGINLSYHQLQKRVSQLSGYLQHQLGMKAGERIAIMMPNCLQQPISVFSSLKAGLVVVNVNPLYTADELHHQLKDSGATCIIVLENMAHIVEKAIKDTNIKHIIITKLSDEIPGIKGMIINFTIKYIKRMIPRYSLKNVCQWSDVLRYIGPCAEHLSTGNDLAFLQYTGGTTGTSKGAMLTHQNLCWNITQAREIVPEGLYQKQTTILTALPLYHIFALTVSMVTLTYGGKNLLVTNPRDIPNLIRLFNEEPIHGFPILNTLMVALLRTHKFHLLDFSHLRATIAGGMPTKSEVAKEWQNVTGCVVNEGYGLSETSPIISLSDNHKVFSGNVGMAAPLTQVKIVDEHYRDLPPDHAGELIVKGPQVMTGYWQDKDNNCFTKDGWFKTGDICSMSAKGQIKILDRIKDMIIVGGFNVYPSEVEDIIVKHHSVVECGVIGEIDDVGNEIIKAYIVTNCTTSTHEIIKHCYKYLTHYKVPKLIYFVDELPKSPVGKVLRRKLRAA